MSAQLARELWERETAPSGQWCVRALRGGFYEVDDQEGEVVGVVDVANASVVHTLSAEALARLRYLAGLNSKTATASIVEARLRLRCAVCGCTSWMPVDTDAPTVAAALHVGESIGACRGCSRELHIGR